MSALMDNGLRFARKGKKMEYRRRKGKDTWHFMKECQHWPAKSADIESRIGKPKSGEFCNECLAKAKRKK